VGTSTRRLAFFAVIVVAITVPAEVLLLRALAVPDQKEAIREWAMSLGPDRLAVETARLQAYPVLYRRELLRAAWPDLRSKTIQAHFDSYLRSRSGLDVNAVALVTTLRSMAVPRMFDTPSEAEKDEVRGVARQLATIIGDDEAAYLMERFGPADGTFASFEPTALYLTNRIRGLFVPLAQGFECDCELDRGCYSPGTSCSHESGCSPYFGWPACGYLLLDPCTGGCLIGG
jgi:hypothetical protein